MKNSIMGDDIESFRSSGRTGMLACWRIAEVGLEYIDVVGCYWNSCAGRCGHAMLPIILHRAQI